MSENEAATERLLNEIFGAPARAVAGGEPTRPSEREWLKAATAAHWAQDDDAGNEHSRLAPLIERTEAAARREVVAAVEALHHESEFGFEHDCADGIGDGCAYVLAARSAAGSES